MSIILDGTNGIVTPDIDSGVSTLGPLTQALNLGSTGQIVFPATQNASANANTLDDYEEGTWTPVLRRLAGSSDYTYTLQNGFYTKIGNLVQVQFAITISAITTQGSRFLEITGLPFTAKNSSFQYSGGSVTVQSCISGEPCSSIGVFPNTTRVALFGTGNPTINEGLLGETGAASVTVITGTLIGSITYQV